MDKTNTDHLSSKGSNRESGRRWLYVYVYLRETFFANADVKE